MRRCSSVAARASTACSGAVASAAPHIGCSSPGGPGQHDDRRAAVGAGRHDEPGGGADRLEDRGSRRHDRLLAIARPQGFLAVGAPARAVARRIARIRSSSAVSSTIARPVKAPTTSAVRSSAVGPSPPEVITRSTPSRARKSSAARMSRRPVADDHDVGQLDACAAQALGQPRAVAVADDAAQHLGAGDDDAGARGHPRARRPARPRAAAAACPRRAPRSRSARRRRRRSAFPSTRMTAAPVPNDMRKRRPRNVRLAGRRRASGCGSAASPPALSRHTLTGPVGRICSRTRVGLAAAACLRLPLLLGGRLRRRGGGGLGGLLVAARVVAPAAEQVERRRRAR